MGLYGYFQAELLILKIKILKTYFNIKKTISGESILSKKNSLGYKFGSCVSWSSKLRHIHGVVSYV
jgi:hypothetical protein